MEEKLKLEIIKNFNVVTCILKQSSFIDDKNIINNRRPGYLKTEARARKEEKRREER